ncbi:MAG: ATP-binding protein [Acidobacteriota bacterium]
MNPRIESGPEDVSPSRSAPVARPRRQRRRVTAFVLGGTAGVILLLGVLNVYARIGQVTPFVGVVWQDGAAGVTVAAVDPRGPAAAAGVEAGDRLRSIDGRPATTASDAGRAVWRTGVDEPLDVEIERRGTVSTVQVRPQPREDGEPLYPYLLTVGLFFLASAVYVLYRLGTVAVTGHYWVLSLAAFCLLAFSHTGRGGTLDGVFYLLDTAGRVLFPALLVHFVLVFPGARRPSRWVSLALYAPAVSLAAATVWRLARMRTGPQTPDVASALDSLALLYMASYLTASLVVVAVRSARETTLSVRRQLRWSAWGIGIGLTPFIVFYLIPRALLVQTPPVAGLSVLPLIVLPLAFCTAILKYRLADLGLYVRGGVTVLTLTFFSLAVFVLLNLVLRETLGGPGIDRRIFTVLAGVLVFFLYPRLSHAVGTVVDRAFYQGRYDYRRTLMQFARELNSERELGSLLPKFHERIRRTLPVRESVLLFPTEASGELRLSTGPGGREPSADARLDTDHPLARRLELEESIVVDRDEFHALPWEMRRLGLTAFFPMRVKGRMVAVLGVGMKDDEELNTEDRQLLETLAAHAAAAMEGARLLEENREQMREVELLKNHNESIVESTRVGILVLDEDQRVRGWNRAMEDLFGKSRDEMIGHTLEAFPLPLAALLREAPGRGRRTLRYNHVGRAGRARTLNVAISDLQGHEQGHGKVVTFDDLTDQLRLEQQLVQSERLASVGLLASGVAHEVNTPLTGISSYAQMMLDDGGVPHRVRDVLERIRKQSWRASHIVNSLLNLARAGGADEEVVDLNEVVEETLALFGPQLKGRQVDLRFAAAAPKAALLRGQKGRLQQVVLNLLMNARDAMPGGGTIRASARSVDGEVVLEVTDTGEGIPAEILGRIYDPFFTTKGPGKGTGLGLSITHGIVRDHGGAIHVHSTPGEGTRFAVHFPALKNAAVSA